MPSATTSSTASSGISAAARPFSLYRDTSIGNEIALGSCLVKPTDFDLEPLGGSWSRPAFIAAPVLKIGETALPGLGFADATRSCAMLSPSSSTQALFLHGGDWRATAGRPARTQQQQDCSVVRRTKRC